MKSKTLRLAKVVVVISFIPLLFSNSPLLKAEEIKNPYKTEVKDGWLYVNGEKFFVKGVVYEGWRPGQAPGAQDPDLDLVDNDFRLIKEAGFNTIRTAGGLTPEMIALAKKHGLMVMYGTWFNQDMDFRDPGKIDYAVKTVMDDVNQVKKFDNIITYLVMNEPSTERVKEAGTAGTEAFYKKIKDAVKSADGSRPVSMADWIPTAFLDHSMWDAVCFNAYIYSPSSIAYSLGYQKYVEWLKEAKAKDKPFIVTEFGLSVSKKTIGQSEPGCYKYGGNTLEEQKEALLKMYGDIIASGAQGACVHEWIDTWWRPSDPSEHADHPEEWYGLLGIDDKKSDIKGTPRPAYHALKEYNQAIVISPKALKFYRGQVPVEVYATEEVTLVQYRINGGNWIGLAKEGNFWWKKELDSKKEKDGGHAFEIRALGKNKKILCSKKIDLWIANTAAPLSLPVVGISLDKDEYAAGQKMKVKIKVTDAGNKPIPNQTVYYSFFQPAGWVENKNQGVTDSNGEVNTQFSTFEPGYVVVSAGIKYKSGDFEKRSGDIKTALFGTASSQAEADISNEESVYQWFCKAQLDNGLIRSAEGLDMCGLYQMATAAMVFTLYGDYDRAEKIFDFYNGKLKEEFSGPKVSERGFIMFHHADGAPYYDTSRWLGDNAWFLMAINHYRSVTGKTKYDGMAKRIVQWIDDLQDKKGKEYPEHNDLGIWGGFEGANNGKFMRFKSTESCIDSYVALYPYKDKKALQDDIAKWLDTMYISQEKKFIIGSNIYGRDEKTDSEMQAWAYLAFRGSSRYPIDLDYLEKNYKLTVKSDDTGKEVMGFAYMPEDHKLGRLEVAPTLAIIAAYYLAGEDKKADFYLKEMEKILIKSRFYPSTMGMPGVANKSRYPNDPSDVHNVTVYTSAWYLFVKKRFNPFQEF